MTRWQSTGHPGSAKCRWRRREPTLDEILAEPIIRAVMVADGLTPADFRDFYHKNSSRPGSTRPPTG
jgi:hypothetical protein